MVFLEICGVPILCFTYTIGTFLASESTQKCVEAIFSMEAILFVLLLLFVFGVYSRFEVVAVITYV